MKILTVLRSGNGIVIFHKDEAFIFINTINGQQYDVNPNAVLILTKKEKVASIARNEHFEIPLIIPEIWNLERHNAIVIDDVWYLGEVFEIRFIADDKSLIPIIFYYPARILFAYLDKEIPKTKLDLFFDFIVTPLDYADLLKLSTELSFDARYVLSFMEKRDENYIELRDGDKISFTRHLTSVIPIQSKGLKDLL